MSRAALLAVLLVVLATGCGGGGPDAPQATDPPGEAPMDQTFDPAQLEVGEEVLGLRVTDVDVREETEIYAARVRFSGQVTVSGLVRVHDEDPFIGNGICMVEVDRDAVRRLPRMERDERRTWFCFSNRGTASDMFGPPGSERRATVVIDDYEIEYAPTESWNTARLVEVVEVN